MGNKASGCNTTFPFHALENKIPAMYHVCVQVRARARVWCVCIESMHRHKGKKHDMQGCAVFSSNITDFILKASITTSVFFIARTLDA